MVRLSVFMSEEAGERIRDIGESWGLSTSLVLREVLMDFLSHREREFPILAPHLPALHPPTPEQQANGERYAEDMLQVDLETVVAELEGRSS
jgi:hypothetical protein